MATTTQPILQNLIYEEFGGRIYYRKGYRKVLLGLKTEEEIMGSSFLQGLMIQALVHFLKNLLPKKQFWVPTNEVGLHLRKNVNFSGDILICEKSKSPHPWTDTYTSLPPKFIIEVDVKIDAKAENEEEGGTEADYILQKSQELLTFGVEGIVWILTKSRQILVIRTHKNVEVYAWSESVPLFEDYTFCLQQILEDEEILPTDKG